MTVLALAARMGDVELIESVLPRITNVDEKDEVVSPLLGFEVSAFV